MSEFTEMEYIKLTHEARFITLEKKVDEIDDRVTEVESYIKTQVMLLKMIITGGIGLAGLVISSALWLSGVFETALRLHK